MRHDRFGACSVCASIEPSCLLRMMRVAQSREIPRVEWASAGTNGLDVINIACPGRATRNAAHRVGREKEGAGFAPLCCSVELPA